MKKIISLLFIIHFTLIIADAQWSQISTINTSQLNAVRFLDEFTGIAGGNSGLWRSINSGVNWIQILNGTNINGLSFPDINIGYAVGDTGKIYKTTDRGLNWIPYYSPVTQNLNAVYFYNNTTGWIVGDSGRIMKTLNGGNSWTVQNSQTTQDLRSIYMSNLTDGNVAGGNTNEILLSTGNGGINWIYLLNQQGNYLNDVCLLSGAPIKIITVGSNGRIRRTTDGMNWIIISLSTLELNSIQFVDSMHGYIAGNYGSILQTTNSGLNWSVINPTGSNFTSLYFINSNLGWAVGQNGVVFRIGSPTGLIQIKNQIPNEFKLYQNYPNPFNSATVIKFDINKNNTYVNLRIYNVLGCEIQILVNTFLKLGSYEIEWNANSCTSGIYFYRLKTNFGSYYKKMILIK